MAHRKNSRPIKPRHSSRRALLAGSPAQDRPEGQRQLDALKQAGGTSLAGLAAILRDPTHPDALRVTAAWLLGVLEQPAALAPLLAAANDPNPEIRWQGILSLGLLRDARALPSLIDHLAATADPAVRQIIVWAMGCIGGSTAVAELTRLLTLLTEHPAVRGAAAEQLGMIGNRTAVPVLLAALQDPETEVRFWSAYALGQLGVKRAIPALESLAKRDTGAVPQFGSIAAEARQAIQHIRQGW